MRRYCVPLVDNVSQELRSFIMSRIKSKNTKPEIKIRRALHERGIRYRIHDKSVMGKPDISIKRSKVAVFLDGCFWHGCKKCYRVPKSNRSYWTDKMRKNQQRRENVRSKLISDGWKVLEYWEHEINKNPLFIARDIERFARRV